jgi:tetratricopeptide (TPR) repeat protein
MGFCMLKKHLCLTLVTLLLAYACTTKKTVVSTESNIKTAYEAQDYSMVLQLFEKFEQTKKPEEVTSTILEMAGLSAYRTENWSKAYDYLNRIASESASPDILGALGNVLFYREELEQEYAHWNKFLPQLVNSSYYQTATTRLFQVETTREAYQKAQAIWELIPDKKDPDLRFDYLSILEKLDKKAQALAYSQEILKDNPTHQPTLYWRAQYYFNKAEGTYQDEMTKYNKNPDYTSYAYLRRELKSISADFRTARDMFIQLRGMNPDNLNYIKYLKNCYLRLEMKVEAVKMDQLLNEPLKK